MEPLCLDARHTHLFPGVRGAVTGGWQPGPCLLRLADGVEVAAELVHGDDPDAMPGGLCLRVAAHVTRAGTAIPERRWCIARTAEGFRIAGNQRGGPGTPSAR